MAQPYFIRVLSQATTGQLGSLPRSIVAVTRETIAGSFPADANSGLVKITAAQVADFKVANPTKYGMLKFLQTAFAGTIQPNEVYILSTAGVALTSAMLDKANYSPRSWSFLTLASQTLGLDDESDYLADALTAATWTTSAKKKVFFFSFAAEETDSLITLPAALTLGGTLTTKQRTKTVVTNAKDMIDEYTPVYHNPLLAALVFCLYGGSIARSIGSLSDAHDFADVATDTFSATSRTLIESNSLCQYNGAKDQGGSLYVYDTFLNSAVNPPTTEQMEAIIAMDYIDDYVPIYVRNALSMAGETGVEASQKGLMRLYSLTDSALQNLWKAGAISTTEFNTADYTLVLKSLAEINALSPNWQTSGEIPVGAIVGQIRAYHAIHYAPILFNYN
jgi:hypothetical protein